MLSKKYFLFSTVLSGLLVLLLLSNKDLLAETMDSYRMRGHGQGQVVYPDWFKQSFLDLREDLDEARNSGKSGLVLFFSQKTCSHCQAFIDTTLSDPATVARIKKNYDVIGVDIFSDLEISDLDGNSMPVTSFADKQKARLVPALLFYDVDKTRLLKIIGFYPPEKFNLVLDYLDGGHYQKEKLSQYLHRVRQSALEQTTIRYDYELFAKPPHSLARTAAKQRQLVVVFENPACPACARFHKRVLSDPNVRQALSRFDAVQLNASDNATLLTTPSGKRMTPQQWAKELQLSYGVALVFFDETGKEIHRLDSETGLDRMKGSIQYVLKKGYRQYEQYMRWRRENTKP